MNKPLIVIVLSLNAAISNAAVYQQLPGHFGGLGSDSISVSADDFQFAQDTLIGGIAWWGGYAPPQSDPDSFSVQLFSDEGGQPGAVLSEFMVGQIDRILTGDFVNAPDEYPEYRYSATLQKNFLAQSDVRYWLSIVNPPGNTWVWEASDSNLSPGSLRSFYGGSWQADEYNVAFELEAVPEPQTGTLVAIGIAVVVYFRSNKGAAPQQPVRTTVKDSLILIVLSALHHCRHRLWVSLIR